MEHKCILQESCKTVRRWQRSILLIKGGHCTGDCYTTCKISTVDDIENGFGMQSFETFENKDANMCFLAVFETMFFKLELLIIFQNKGR